MLKSAKITKRQKKRLAKQITTKQWLRERSCQCKHQTWRHQLSSVHIKFFVGGWKLSINNDVFSRGRHCRIVDPGHWKKITVVEIYCRSVKDVHPFAMVCVPD